MSIVRLSAFFQRFQTKADSVSVNETKITTEDALIKVILKLKIPMNHIFAHS